MQRRFQEMEASCYVVEVRVVVDSIFYLMSRGLSEEDAKALIVRGFADNVSKELPLEYAVEMNNLIKMEMEGTA